MKVKVTWHGDERTARNFRRLCDLAWSRALWRGAFAGCRA